MSTLAPASATTGRLKQEFEELFREHSQMLYRTAYSMLDNRADAEDVLQTIFLRLLRRESPQTLTSNPRGYLYRAAVNLSLNIIRGRKRHDLVGEVRDLEAVLNGPDVASQNAHRRLVDVISGLDPETAEILILRYVHGYTDAEIARLLGLSRGTIAMKVFRSRAHIKKLIQEDKKR